MRKIKKKLWLAIVFAIAMVAVANVFVKDTFVQKQVLQETTSGVAPAKGGTANQTQAYSKLVSQYVGKRIQFDAQCQATPNNVTYKTGTSVMFDNRSGDARIITIGGVKYNFPGYGYKILTLSSSKLPKTYMISCGAAVNVGQVLIQR